MPSLKFPWIYVYPNTQDYYKLMSIYKMTKRLICWTLEMYNTYICSCPASICKINQYTTCSNQQHLWRKLFNWSWSTLPQTSIVHSIFSTIYLIQTNKRNAVYTLQHSKENYGGCRLPRANSARRIFFLGPCTSSNLCENSSMNFQWNAQKKDATTQVS